MDDKQFDTFSRQLGTGLNRRTTLRSLLLGAAALGGIVMAEDDALGKERKKKKKKKTCQKKDMTCSARKKCCKGHCCARGNPGFFEPFCALTSERTCCTGDTPGACPKNLECCPPTPSTPGGSCCGLKFVCPNADGSCPPGTSIGNLCCEPDDPEIELMRRSGAGAGAGRRNSP